MLGFFRGAGAKALALFVLLGCIAPDLASAQRTIPSTIVGRPVIQQVTGDEIIDVRSAGGVPSVTRVGDLLGDMGLRMLSGDRIASPSTGPTATAGAAGALSGSPSYTVTFVTAQGETAPYPGTMPSPPTLSSQMVNVANIPVGPTGVIARRLYRTKLSGSVDVKDYYLVTEISDNVTTTYVDNIADASLGAAANWAPTNRGYLTDANGTIMARIADQSINIGTGNATNYGYANAFGGFGAGISITSGRRLAGWGEYAFTSCTTCYEGVANGTHAGQYITTQPYNTFSGAYAGFYAGYAGSTGAATENALYGWQAGYGTTSGGLGQQNTCIGPRACYSINSADGVIALGNRAGQYANLSGQLFIDSAVRGSITAAQDQGLIFGRSRSTVQTQDLRLNSITRIGGAAADVTATNVTGQTCNAALAGYRGWVSDSNAAYSGANIGATVAGGGSNKVPVFCNGTNWVIGFNVDTPVLPKAANDNADLAMAA